MSSETRQIDLGDAFANIAGLKRRTHGKLVASPPPKLYGRLLKATHSDPQAAFRPAGKLDTPEKLKAAIGRERRRYEEIPARSGSIGGREFDFSVAGVRLALGNRKGFAGFSRPAGWCGCLGMCSNPRIPEKMWKEGAFLGHFRGVDYKAHVFINGAYLGSHEGFFAPVEFDLTSVAKRGEIVLLVKVENEAVPIPFSDVNGCGMNNDGDKLYAATGPGWDEPGIGWHCRPQGMGIYQAVRIEARPELHLNDVFVRPLPEQKQAEIWLEVANSTSQPRQEVSFSISIFGQNFRSTVCRDREFRPKQKARRPISRFRFLADIPNFRLWEPETPWLYQIQVTLPNGDMLARPLRTCSCRMGLRHFVSRQTGRSSVAEFGTEDSLLWHDSQKDRITPLLTSTFTAEGWKPAMLSGNDGAWGGAWKPALAAAEKCHGQGSFLICQVAVADGVKTNPVAMLFARNLHP